MAYATCVLRIGLISDTHMPPWDMNVVRQVNEVFAGVDLILHAGDVVTARVLDWLETIAPVSAAIGNNDLHLAGDPRMKPLQTLSHEGVSIGMFHVYEPWDRDPRVVVREKYSLDACPDVVVVGDTHFEAVENRGGVLLVNPGSPTTPHLRTDMRGTVGILRVSEGHAQAEIVTLGNPLPSSA